MSYNQHFDISDSAVEAYYGWSDDAPCASCGHKIYEHTEKSVKDIADRCEPCSHKDCDCPDYMEGEWDVRRDEYDD